MKTHVFEQAGLGKAPFNFAGCYEHHSGGEIDYGTSCDYCGNYIRNVFMIRSADGKQFGVGCDCVKKTGDKGLERVVSREVAKLRRAKMFSDFHAAEANLETYKQEISAQPHPYMSNLNLFDYITHILDKAHKFECYPNALTDSQIKRVISAVRKASKDK